MGSVVVQNIPTKQQQELQLLLLDSSLCECIAKQPCFCVACAGLSAPGGVSRASEVQKRLREAAVIINSSQVTDKN